MNNIGKVVNCLKFKVAQFNIRSIFTGFHDFKSLVEDCDFDLIFLTETWLSDGDETATFIIPGYRLIREDRRGRGGGVAVYVKNNLFPELINFEFNVTDYLEFLIIKIKLKNKFYAFCVFYRPPNTNFNNVINDFDNIFSALYPIVEEIICLGDFNVNLLNEDNPLTLLFENYNFVQIINQPTRVSRTSSTLLDPIFITDNTLVVDSGTVALPGVSDHLLVYCCLNIEKVHTVPRTIKYRNFNNFNFNSFLIDLHALQWNDIIYEQNIDNKINLFNNLLCSLFDKHAPYKESRITKPRAPWLTPNLKVFMKNRDRALQKFKRTRAIHDWEDYKNLRNFAVAMVRREKRQYLDSICAENNPRKTWNSLKSFNISSNKNCDIPDNLSNPNNISKFFGSYLQTVSDCSPKVNFYNNNIFDNELTFSFRLIEVADIHKIIHSITSNASGVDGVSLKMLKYCSPHIDQYVTHIINCCLETNYFPDQWKISVGKPLTKTNSPTTFNDLRIISILPLLSKIFEKSLYGQLFHFCVTNKIIPESQCGFRKDYSTSVALVKVIDDIMSAVDKKLNTALVLLDFSKAFDTLNHELLLAKLKYYGLDESSLNLIRSYFTNRVQKIFYNNNYSDQIQILSGVPQGSILGPLFFIIYTSDILKSLKHCKIQAYADDTQIFIHFDCQDYLVASNLLNEDLNILNQLSLNHNLKLNPLKSFLMLFGNGNNVAFLKESINIVLDGVKLPVVKTAKNLGIILDTDLRFRDYVTKLIQRSYMSLKVLYNNRHILNFKMRKMLCESLVLSNFNYCDFIYGPCLDVADTYRIQKVQNTCARLIYGLRKFDHISHTFKNLNWLLMTNRRTLHLGSFLLKLLNNESLPPSLKNKFVFRDTVHSRDTRFSYKLTMPHHRSAMFQRSFTFNAVKLYNSLPNEFILLDINGFKLQYKKHLLNLQNSQFP